MDKKIIFFDVDGTLFDNDTLKVPNNTITALKELAKDERFILALATGRTYKTINVIDEIKDLFRLKILINGQVIMYDKKIIYNNSINVKHLNALKTYLLEKSIPQGFVGLNDECVTTVNEFVKECFRRYDMTLPTIDLDYKKDVYQTWIFASEKEIQEAENRFKEFSFFRWENNGADIISKGISKAHGIKYAINWLKIPLKNTFAIGDGNNDYEMIKDVNVGIAMGNASPMVKAVANYITDDIKNDGLAKALEYIKNLTK